jgi:hypothetical protein
MGAHVWAGPKCTFGSGSALWSDSSVVSTRLLRRRMTAFPALLDQLAAKHHERGITSTRYRSPELLE